MKEKVTMKQILFMTMFIFTTVLFGSGDMSVVRAADKLSEHCYKKTTENGVTYKLYDTSDNYVTPIKAKADAKYYAGETRCIVVATAESSSTTSATIDIDNILSYFSSQTNNSDYTLYALVVKDINDVTLTGKLDLSNLSNSNYTSYIRVTGAENITDRIVYNGTTNSNTGYKILEELEASMIVKISNSALSLHFTTLYRNITIGNNNWHYDAGRLSINTPVSSEFYDITLKGLSNIVISNHGVQNSTLQGTTTISQTLATSTGYKAVISPSASIATESLTAGTYTNTQTANTYTATYNANGGSVSTASKTVTYDSTYGTLATPTRTGYTFAGWWTAASGGTQITASTKVSTASNHTLYAHWNVNTYTVTLDLNGGTSDTTSVKVTYDSAYTGLPTPTKTGYTFIKWYKDETPITIDTKVSTAADHTLVANYKANTYTVMFSANGGTCDIGSVDYTYDSLYKQFPTPTRDGYSFAGWYTEKEGGTRVKETDTVKITSGVMYYAHWSAKTYTVTFDAQGGTCGTSYITVAPNAVYGFLPSAEKSGYTFVGWATDKSGTNFIHEDSVNTRENDFTVYAIYKKNSTSSGDSTSNGNSSSGTNGSAVSGSNGVDDTKVTSQSVSEQTKAVQSTKATIKKVTNKKGKKLQVKINKVDGYKYQIQVSTSKKFMKAKKYNTSKTSYTVKKLKKGKKYYVRVRLYKKVNGKNVYGKWSKVKSVKIKK